MNLLRELQYATPLEWLLMLFGASVCCAVPVVMLVAILGAMRE